MGEAVEQRRGHLRIAEDSRPFTEAEFCVENHAGAFVELAQEREQQCAAGGAEPQVAKLVEDDEVGVVFLLFQGVGEFDGREEPEALAMTFDRLDADGGG